MMTEEEHRQYHLEVGLECGECTLGEALKMHFEALWEEETEERRAREIQNKRAPYPLASRIHCDFCDAAGRSTCECFLVMVTILLLMFSPLLGAFLWKILV